MPVYYVGKIHILLKHAASAKIAGK